MLLKFFVLQMSGLSLIFQVGRVNKKGNGGQNSSWYKTGFVSK